MNHTQPPLKSSLDRKRVLSPSCGLRVSPICLGTMSLGEEWKADMGEIDKEGAFKLLDKFYDLGGNFLDTANGYHLGDSERWIGEWMKERGNRDELVVATKYTSLYKKANQKVNFAGNQVKNMVVSVENSLKNLQTTYIDILYVHWWDYTCSIEEVMQGLNNLVKQGKVLYLGISDSPAWIVSAANQYARDHGLSPFVIYQGLYNINKRDMERDIIPMALHQGMAIAPFGVLGQGKLKAQAEVEELTKDGKGLRTGVSRSPKQSEDQIKVSALLEKIGKEFNVSVAAVAIAWSMQKYPYVFPIIGGRKIDQLEQNIESLNIRLTKEHFEELEGITKFELGFPMELLGPDPAMSGEMSFVAKLAGHYDVVKRYNPIIPK